MWNGHLAAAIAVDGHNWMYPVAYGFIASETTDNWTWFMEQLKKAIGNPSLLVVCSDACKGLENAVKMCSQMQSKENVFIILREICRRGLEGSVRYILRQGLTKKAYSMTIYQKW
jgi:hypothetical protein